MAVNLIINNTTEVFTVDATLRLLTRTAPDSPLPGYMYSDGDKLWFRSNTTWIDLTSGSGSGLWNANGSDIYYSSGKVGIGTSSPDTSLHVVFTDGSPQLILERINSNTSKFSFGANSGGFVIRDEGDNADRLTIDTDGNVEIGENLDVSGAFTAISKSFLIDHPSKPGMKLQYGSLEGPEHGVYCRGHLKDQSCIDLPDYWINLVDEYTITVTLTPANAYQKLYVSFIGGGQVFVKNETGKEIDCFYTVYGERKDVAKLDVEIG